MEAELKAIGADHVWLMERICPNEYAILGGRGVDRALDAVAGRASGRMFDAVADFGTLICYGLLGSDEIIFLCSAHLQDVHVGAIHDCAICAHYPKRRLNASNLLLALKKGSFSADS